MLVHQLFALRRRQGKTTREFVIISRAGGYFTLSFLPHIIEGVSELAQRYPPWPWTGGSDLFQYRLIKIHFEPAAEAEQMTSADGLPWTLVAVPYYHGAYRGQERPSGHR